MTKLFEKRVAVFSEDRQYRTHLEIVWNNSLPVLVVIGLNPSTADELNDDPTVRRWKGFAADWGYGGIKVYNIFPFRATDPEVMKAHADPIGTQRDLGIVIRHENLGPVLCCWGTHGSHLGRGDEVLAQLRQWFEPHEILCLGINSDGSPKHPLYLAKATERIPYAGATR